MCCKVACQIFPVLLLRKKIFTLSKTQYLSKIIKKSLLQKITKTNNTQLSIQMILLNMYTSPTKYVYIDKSY